ncbi:MULTISPECIES: hypothetical protein [unclassified Serratia (in: enterobacteria)]|uniref:hypothetical protein n=1 Tax=unclassified Serratia (in: enterobacteria) TaxID=2647522 RepID=UPI002ED60C12|nr:hypothetical protein [Serratia sp. C2(2)]MEE4447808.1 hypothetical protein [Serratia sp. C2(1)]
MRKLMGISMLLAWMPLSHASLNAAPVSAVLNQQLTAACNLLTTQHADWGNINAVVRSARVCLQRPAGLEQSERLPTTADRGLAQRSNSLLPDLTQDK